MPKFKNSFRIIICHLILYIFVIIYILCGAHIFHYLEGEYEIDANRQSRIEIMNLKNEMIYKITHSNEERIIDETIQLFLGNISSLHISLDNFILFYNSKRNPPKRWTYQSSVLFAFTILTTIGYGNVVPSTREGRVFTMIYGAIGIPLFLITIADIGQFFKTFVMYLIKRIYKKELKKYGEKKFSREIAEVIFVAILFLIFIAVGSAVLPLWEHNLTYFDSVYLSYMSLTTIGLGDVVPRRMDFLIPTLIYITIGLWLTTALVEQLVDVFRLIHYYGRKVRNVKGITIWIGGQPVSIGTLIHTVCRRIGMPDQLMGQINWDQAIDQGLLHENDDQNDNQSLFPWHFVDFVNNDPPLIDLSFDYEQMEDKSPHSAKNKNINFN
ncbi:unnamed protein product [Dracunculus medinensis]|uniref:Ion_trans_2 domain-containing protein n=1 Tax=Dracunculus medinensis TaxID=318479 RepID=A0A158Q5B2_DRAME|nr:unnamed protein product [Dracunculus medinensis]